jgi:hypothetical protein
MHYRYWARRRADTPDTYLVASKLCHSSAHRVARDSVCAATAPVSSGSELVSPPLHTRRESRVTGALLWARVPPHCPRGRLVCRVLLAVLGTTPECRLNLAAHARLGRWAPGIPCASDSNAGRELGTVASSPEARARFAGVSARRLASCIVGAGCHVRVSIMSTILQWQSCAPCCARRALLHVIITVS